MAATLETTQIVFSRIPCPAKYLCETLQSDSSRATTCYLIGRDYEGCPVFAQENVMYVPPHNIGCSHAFNCKYAGKREEHCEREEGHADCGTTIGDKIPRGDVPDSLVGRIRTALEKARKINAS